MTGGTVHWASHSQDLTDHTIKFWLTTAKINIFHPFSLRTLASISPSCISSFSLGHCYSLPKRKKNGQFSSTFFLLFFYFSLFLCLITRNSLETELTLQSRRMHGFEVFSEFQRRCSFSFVFNLFLVLSSCRFIFFLHKKSSSLLDGFLLPS